jgi:hypothetical protein
MSITVLVSKILPVVLLLGIGAVARKKQYLTEAAVTGMKQLVVQLALPALLFLSFLHTGFQMQYVWILLAVFFANFIMLLAGKLLQKAVARENRYLPLLYTGFEMGMLGFSLYGSLYGTENLGIIGILDLGQEIFVWFILTTLIRTAENRTPVLKTAVLDFVRTPAIIAIFLGILCNSTGTATVLETAVLTSGILSAVSLISQLTIPLILIVVGYQLNLHLAEFRLPLFTVVTRLVLLCALAVAIDLILFRQILHLPPEFSVALYAMFILPPPFIIPLFMKQGDRHLHEYVGNTLSLGTLATLAGYVVLVLCTG